MAEVRGICCRHGEEVKRARPGEGAGHRSSKGRCKARVVVGSLPWLFGAEENPMEKKIRPTWGPPA
jgi:hypothetical protein